MSAALRAFVSVSSSPLMQMVMLVLVESIRRTLCTGSWKLESVLASEAAQVWIITPAAFIVHACRKGGKDERPIVSILSSLSCLSKVRYTESTCCCCCFSLSELLLPYSPLTFISHSALLFRTRSKLFTSDGSLHPLRCSLSSHAACVWRITGACASV